MRVGFRLALAAALLVATLALWAVASSGALAAGTKPKLDPPTLLWKTYPLVQHPRAHVARTPPSSERREASAPSSGQTQPLDHMLLLTALLATFLAAGSILFLRRPATARVGGSARGRSGARTPRPARRPEPRRPRSRTKAPPAREPEPAPPPSDLSPERTTEPVVPAEDEAAPDAPDAVERALDGLLEALEPHARQQRTPELDLRELIVRKYSAPASARPRIDREIDEALDRIEKRRVAEARARAAPRTSLARSETKLWRGFVKSQLYAAMVGSEDAFALSEPFRLRDVDQPTSQARRELTTLLANLAQTGWTVVAHGAAWYERTLELRPPDSGADPPREAHDDEDGPPRVVYRTTSRSGEAGNRD
jgi:hypothetical protein